MAALVGIGMPTAPAAVAVMIYRLISMWLVLLVGWIIQHIAGLATGVRRFH